MSVAKGEKVGIFQRIKRYYRGVAGELKKVHWPNRKELFSYTMVVLVSVVIVGTIIWVFDLGLSKIMRFVIGV